MNIEFSHNGATWPLEGTPGCLRQTWTGIVEVDLSVVNIGLSTRLTELARKKWRRCHSDCMGSADDDDDDNDDGGGDGGGGGDDGGDDETV